MNEFLLPLAHAIADGFARREPYFCDPVGGNAEGVFRSHYDWHSSVHAHGSLLSMSRICVALGFEAKYFSEQREMVLSRLNITALETERSRLLERPQFELPYGQAWLLLLLAELELHGARPEELRVEVQERVLSWIEQTSPLDQKDNTVRGDYQSWFFIYLIMLKSFTSISRDDRFLIRLEALKLKLEQIKSIEEGIDQNEFVSAKAIWKVIKRERSADPALHQKLSALPELEIKNCHRVGVLVSESWPLARASSLSPEDRLRFDDFLRLFMNETRLWRDDFVTVGHWIPQFIWFGIYLSTSELNASREDLARQ